MTASEAALIGRSGVEFLYQSVEGGFELGLVLVRMSADEIDDLTVVISGLFVVAASLVDHSQSIVAIVDLGEAHEEIPCCQFGFVEFAIVDHIDDRVRCGGEFIGVIIAKRVTAEVAVRAIVVMVMGAGGESLGSGLGENSAFGALILLEATALVLLSAAAVARVVASDLGFGHGGPFYRVGARTWSRRSRRS